MRDPTMVLLRYLTAMVGTLFARLRRGPLRPSWSFAFEASVAFLRATSRAASGRPALEQRAVWSATRAPRSPVMKRVRRERVDVGGVPADWFVPRASEGEPDHRASERPVVLFMHGGSFIFGSNDSHEEMIARIALAADARVLAIEYRLAPEATFPAAIEDAMTAYRWLRAQGVPERAIVLAGDSAGGNLSLTTLLALRERGEPLPAGAMPICPWVDPLRAGGSMATNERFDWGVEGDFADWRASYAGGADPEQPAISPLRVELTGLPSLLVLWGECELLRDQVRDFVAAANAAGLDVEAHEHPDMVHDWMTLHAHTPEAEAAYQEMGAFVRRVTKR